MTERTLQIEYMTLALEELLQVPLVAEHTAQAAEVQVLIVLVVELIRQAVGIPAVVKPIELIPQAAETQALVALAAIDLTPRAAETQVLIALVVIDLTLRAAETQALAAIDHMLRVAEVHLQVAQLADHHLVA